ncbi:hypothetical protein Cgig2_003625 [Carnegiea gigantea]|uniref:Uncharacterized protein n=1 Tax=Carnegiea gigantea TaxID=171969 RepID=A0A9Q1K6I1_9CARY|nr:hypothetical protein Cgig2_003625 [Carnegiea gigantea]
MLFLRFIISLPSSFFVRALLPLFALNPAKVLPTLGAIYEEFLPPNKDLVDHNKYPAIVIELLHIHAELYKFHNAGYIYYDLWLDHFYGEYFVYFVYGEQTNSDKGKVEAKKRGPLRIPRQEQMTNLNITARDVIRPETFVMAVLMASGQRISLAPTVLDYIYHGLGEATSHSDPSKAKVIFPSHYVIGRLAELFPYLYRRHTNSDCAGDFSTLLRYTRLLGTKLSLPQVDTFSGMRDIFLSELALIVKTF